MLDKVSDVAGRSDPPLNSALLAFNVVSRVVEFIQSHES